MTSPARSSVSNRLTTDTSVLLDLITGIRKGEIKVPKFQRDFVWKEEQAVKLLDSISFNYPVGSLLLWKTKEKLRAERNIGDFTLPTTDDLSPTDYVLDGQQRLTVIYSCLGAPETEGGFAIAYDLNKEEFIKMPENPSLHHFNLRKIFNTTVLLNFRTGLMSLTEAKEYQDKLDALIQAFTNYRLPVVTLRDMSVEEVCPIFERINSSGTKLSTFDLMVAATWSNAFDLNDEVEKIQKSLEPKGFEDIKGDTVLKCMAAIAGSSVKDESIKSLRDLNSEDINALTDKTKAALLMTVDLLSTEFKIHSWSFLSYEALTIIIVSIFNKLNHNFDHDQMARLRQWFWRSSFSERYKVGGENFVTNDLDRVYQYVVDGKGSKENFGSPPSADQLGEYIFRSNSSRSRAYILALAHARPTNLTNGATIDVVDALSTYNKKQFHHIYPRAYMSRTAPEVEDNLCVNICMLMASENNKISDSDPHVYIPQLIKVNAANIDKILESNLMPKSDEFDYSTGTYEEFVSCRIPKILDVINRLCDGDLAKY